MSHTKPNKTDSLNEYFTALTDFIILLPNLEKAKDVETFTIWFDKLFQIDPRALLRWVKENRDTIPDDFIAVANARYRRRL